MSATDDVSRRLNAAVEAMNLMFQSVVRTFIALNLGVTATVELVGEPGERRHFLRFGKTGADWSLTVGHIPVGKREIEQWQPVESVSKQLRRRALQSVAALVYEMVETAERQALEIERDVEDVRAYLERLKSFK